MSQAGGRGYDIPFQPINLSRSRRYFPRFGGSIISFISQPTIAEQPNNMSANARIFFNKDVFIVNIIVKFII
ncbi:hypothetical protein JCM10512_23 [Bacteroides reticulotermitis JCM 10512]|uniref:Uncharacterized protein n=1 Tax=Bacteroides reticulotermitis JCM 10512 TaxID=1445607 RepID=W4UML9_9BACE|nr:hypothetical protein JCM10512_23 [Bacteroides reticulotermitis JCM 10512]